MIIGASALPAAAEEPFDLDAVLAAARGAVVVVVPLFGVLAACTSAIPDGLINLPPTARAYWLDPDHRPRLDALLHRYLLTVGTAVLLLLAVSVTGAIVRPEGSPILSVGIWAVLAVIAVIAVAYLAWQAYQYRDIIAVRVADKAPRLARWLRSF
mgnify:CR=1 FL=1